MLSWMANSEFCPAVLSAFLVRFCLIEEDADERDEDNEDDFEPFEDIEDWPHFHVVD